MTTNPKKFYVISFQFLFPPKRIVTKLSLPSVPLHIVVVSVPFSSEEDRYRKGKFSNLLGKPFSRVSVPFSSEEDRYEKHLKKRNVVKKVSVPFSSEEDRYNSSSWFSSQAC